MYINFGYLNKLREEKEFGYIDYLLLIAINQKNLSEFEDGSDFGKKHGISFLEENGYIEKYKTTDGYKVLPKGKTVLRRLALADSNEVADETFAKIVLTYKAYGYNNKLKAKAKGLRFFNQFMAETNYNPDDIVDAVEEYLDTTESTFVNNIDTLVFKPSNVYATRFNIEESKLNIIVKNYVNADS